jgi:hypothetical protein
MKPRITVITTGVDDLETSLRFYREGLGLRTEGIIGKGFEHGAVAFFDLQVFTLGHNVSSKAKVDAVMEQVKAGECIKLRDVLNHSL